MSVEVFKLHTGTQNGNASTGKVEIFDSRERFLSALYQAACEAEGDINGRSDERQWRFRRWLENLRPGWDKGWHTSRVIKAQKLTASGWVDLEWTLHAPRIEVEL